MQSDNRMNAADNVNLIGLRALLINNEAIVDEGCKESKGYTTARRRYDCLKE
jgi:hypothetical protein